MRLCCIKYTILLTVGDRERSVIYTTIYARSRHAIYIKNNIQNHNETNSKTREIKRQAYNVVGNNVHCTYNNN